MKGLLPSIVIGLFAIGIILASIILLILGEFHLFDIKFELIEKIELPSTPERGFNAFLEQTVEEYGNLSLIDLISSYLITKDSNLRDTISSYFENTFNKGKYVLILDNEDVINPKGVNLDKKHFTAFIRIATINGYKTIQLRYYK